MKVRIGTTLLVIALGAIALFGQEPSATQKPKPPAPPAAPAPAPAPPAPTELERTQLENLQLRMALIQDEENSLPQRRNEIQQKYSVLIQQIQHEHPGYVWNPQAGTLVKAPEPPKPPAPKTEPKK